VSADDVTGPLAFGVAISKYDGCMFQMQMLKNAFGVSDAVHLQGVSMT
jgi:hypothetical protein